MISIKEQFDIFNKEVLSEGYDKDATFRIVFYAGALSMLGELGHSEITQVEEEILEAIKMKEPSIMRDIMLDDILVFHEKFKLEYPDQPMKLSEEESKFRINFMQEELDEYVAAETLEDKFDALIDLVYVTLGTAYRHGLPFAKGWQRVHNANIAKERAERADQSKRGTSLDIIKPEGWKAPDLTDLV